VKLIATYLSPWVETKKSYLPLSMYNAQLDAYWWTTRCR